MLEPEPEPECIRISVPVPLRQKVAVAIQAPVPQHWLDKGLLVGCEPFVSVVICILV
jgi:hypothetical protein